MICSTEWAQKNDTVNTVTEARVISRRYGHIFWFVTANTAPNEAHLGVKAHTNILRVHKFNLQLSSNRAGKVFFLFFFIYWSLHHSRSVVLQSLPQDNDNIISIWGFMDHELLSFLFTERRVSSWSSITIRIFIFGIVLKLSQI